MYESRFAHTDIYELSLTCIHVTYTDIYELSLTYIHVYSYV